MKEIWKDIEGYEGLYQVSNLGRVKSLERQVWKKRQQCYLRVRGRIKQQAVSCWGYWLVSLSANGVNKYHSVHRLVAQAFVPNPENKPDIDHINTIKTDNRAENLRWVTKKENSNNPLTLKHMSNGQKLKGNKYCKFGKDHPNSIPIVQLTKEGEFVKEWACAADAWREGYSYKHISACLRKIRKTANGCLWLYKDDYEKGERITKTPHSNSKSVKQLTLNDELVKKWDSVSQIQKTLGFLQGNISSCCRGVLRTAYGFKWQYC